jgi:hypothetical protein
MTGRQSFQAVPQVCQRAALGPLVDPRKIRRGTCPATRVRLGKLIRPLLGPWHPAVSRAFGDFVIVVASRPGYR